jgi:hypothetical protein
VQPKGLAQVEITSSIEGGGNYLNEVAQYCFRNDTFVPGEHRLELVVPEEIKKIKLKETKNIINEGKVAKIIDVYTVVINRGSEHGVEEDMRFVIYEPGDEIKDPDGGSLGIFEHVKAKVEVTNVSEKFSTAKTYETHTMTMPALQEAIVTRSHSPGNGSDDAQRATLR